MTDDVDVQPWYEIPRSEWTPRDWLYAAAAEVLRVGVQDIDEFTPSLAAQAVMDFADENCE